MAILNFPDNPQTGDQYTGDNGTTYIFDGVKWLGTAGSGTSGTNSIVNNGNTVQVDSTGNLVLPAFSFPNTAGSTGQVLKWPSSGTTLVWSDDNNSGGTANLGNLTVTDSTITSSDDYVGILGGDINATFAGATVGNNYSEFFAENDNEGAHQGLAWIRTDITDHTAPFAFIDVQSSTTGISRRWTFNKNGVLTLPVGGDIKDSTGHSVLGGGGSGATVTVGTTTTGAAGSSASVTNVGTTTDAVFNFTIPRGSQGLKGDTGNTGAKGDTGDTGAKGDKGDTGDRGFKGNTGEKGDKGDAGTITVGTVTTGLPGSDVSIENVGSTTDAVFDFAIPRGNTGPAGTPGSKGDRGEPGLNGVGDPGPQGDKGDTGAQGVSVTLQGTKATIADLPAAPLDPNDYAGHAWIVTLGDEPTHLNGALWFWNLETASWNDIGKIVGPQGDKGDTGDRGLTGSNGADGAGVPMEGTTDQVLLKVDGEDFNTYWADGPKKLYNNGYNFTLGVDGTINFDPSINGKGVLQTPADLEFVADTKNWIFDTTGDITVPGDIKRGNVRFSLNDNVYLTPEPGDTAALTIYPHYSELYAPDSVNFYTRQPATVLSSVINENTANDNVLWVSKIDLPTISQITTDWYLLFADTQYGIASIADETPIPGFVAITFQDEGLAFPYRSSFELHAPDIWNEWQFSNDGALYLPVVDAAALITTYDGGNIQLQPKPATGTTPGGNLYLYAGDSSPTDVSNGGSVNILATAGNGGSDGVVNITTPGGLLKFDEYGRLVVPDNNFEIFTPSAGEGNKNIDIYTNGFDGGGVEVYLQHDDQVSIITNNGGYSWNFDKTGVLTLPNGASIGSSGLLSGIPMTTDRGTVLFGNSPECVPTLLTHFHIMKEDASAVDLFLGDDNNYVKLPGDGETAYGVEIGTNGPDGANTWRFDTDGTLTLAGVPSPNFFNDNGKIQYTPSGWTEVVTVGVAPSIPGCAGAFRFNKTLYEFYFPGIKLGDLIALDSVDVGYPVEPRTGTYQASITYSQQDPDNADYWIIGQNNAGVALPEGTSLWLKYDSESISLNNFWAFRSNGVIEVSKDTLTLSAFGNTLAIDNQGNIALDQWGEGGADRGLVWRWGEYHEGGINSSIRQEEGGLYITGYNVSDSITRRWQFDGETGGLTFPDATTQYTAFTVDSTESAPEKGLLWFNPAEARMYVKYNEQWVDASPTVLPEPDTNPTLESVTFNDNTTQTTAWAGSTDRITKGDNSFIIDDSGNITIPGGAKILYDGQGAFTLLSTGGSALHDNNSNPLAAITGDVLWTAVIADTNSDINGALIRIVKKGLDDYTPTTLDWKFSSDGVLRMPDGGFGGDGRIDFSFEGYNWARVRSHNRQVYLESLVDNGPGDPANGNILTQLSVGTEILLITDWENAQYTWNFSSDGTLRFPDLTVQNTAWQGVAIVSATAPNVTETKGRLWFNTTDARMYTLYNDQWVDASPTVLPEPDTNPTLETVTFNDNTTQTTAWTGTFSYNNLTDKPMFVGGGNASSWLTAE